MRMKLQRRVGSNQSTTPIDRTREGTLGDTTAINASATTSAASRQTVPCVGVFPRGRANVGCASANLATVGRRASVQTSSASTPWTQRSASNTHTHTHTHTHIHIHKRSTCTHHMTKQHT